MAKSNNSTTKKNSPLPLPEGEQFFELLNNGNLDIGLEKGRNFESTAICGDKRRGKSTLANVLIHNYRKKYPNRPVLLLDYSNAFEKKSFKGVEIPGYDAWTVTELLNGKIVKINGVAKRARWNTDPKKGAVGIIRVVGFSKGEDFDLLLDFISKQFRGGLVIIDEAATMFDEKATMEQRGLLIKHTNSKNDLWCIFHRLMDVPRQLRHHFWNYILFGTGDEFSSWKDLEKANFPDPKRFYERFRLANDFPMLKADGTRNLISYYDTFSKDPANPAEAYRKTIEKDLITLAAYGRHIREKGIDAVTVTEQKKVLIRKGHLNTNT